MAKKDTFRAALERLTAEQIHRGAPAVAIMLALTMELERVGIIAAAAHDLDHEELVTLRRRGLTHEKTH